MFRPKNLFRPKLFLDQKNCCGPKNFFKLKISLRQKFFLAGAKKYLDTKILWETNFFGTWQFVYTKKFKDSMILFLQNSIHALCQLDQVTRFVSTLPQLRLSLDQLSPSLLLFTFYFLLFTFCFLIFNFYFLLLLLLQLL